MNIDFRHERLEDLDRTIRSLATRLDFAVANTRRALDGQEDLMQRLVTLEYENDMNRRINDVLLHQFSLLQNTAHQARQETENLDGINNVRASSASAFRRTGRNIGEHLPSGLQASGIAWPSYAYPTFSPLVAPAHAVPAAGVYLNSTNAHVDNQHSMGLNNANRDGFELNQTAQLGYQSHNISTSAFGAGSGQPVLNNLTLNNQIQQPRPRANNYWDNFRSYSRQNLLSSPKMNGAIPSSCNTDSRQAAGSLFLPEQSELNNQSGASHVQNNIRPDLVVNRNPMGNGSKAHLRSPQFVENIATSKKKNKDQSQIFRLNSSAANSNAAYVEDRVETHTDQEPGSSAAMYRASGDIESRSASFKVTTSDASDTSRVLAVQVNKFLDENGHRPAYVVDLLRKLSSLNTDEARQRAINALQTLVDEQTDTVRINEGPPPPSPIRTPPLAPQQLQQHPQLGVVVPFNVNRTDTEENEHPEAEQSGDREQQEPATNSGLTTTVVTTASGLQLTRVTRDCTGRTAAAPVHDHESNESVPATRGYDFRLEDLISSQNLDSDDGEIHDLMDLTPQEADRRAFENEARRREEGGEVQAVQGEDSVEDGINREADDEHAGEEDASAAGFVPIRF